MPYQNSGAGMRRTSSAASDSAKELVEYIALSLVDDPSAVEVTQERYGRRVRLSLYVAKEDMGRIIGKNGRVANSVRALMRVTAGKDGSQMTLDILEP